MVDSLHWQLLDLQIVYQDQVLVHFLVVEQHELWLLVVLVVRVTQVQVALFVLVFVVQAVLVVQAPLPEQVQVLWPLVVQVALG
jgi:hypothetical protein